MDTETIALGTLALIFFVRIIDVAMGTFRLIVLV